jgi:hypothetical protein
MTAVPDPTPRPVSRETTGEEPASRSQDATGGASDLGWPDDRREVRDAARIMAGTTTGLGWPA